MNNNKMVGGTRIEINFNRLLTQCQTMAEDKENRDWRLEKYIGALQGFLVDMKRSQSKPAQEALLEYQKKVDLLKGLLEAEKKPAVIQRALITESLRPISAEVSSAPAKQLQVKAKVKCEQDLRAELLGTSKSNSQQNDQSEGVRHRKKPQEEEDINIILQHHNKMQERLAEQMLMHTKALKQNITEAGRAVREDTKVISDSTRLATDNSARLKVEGERLEAHTKSCSWWIWVMLGVVVITFISMVIFMKFFSK